MTTNLESLRAAFKKDPGVGFVELAQALLENDETRAEAREVCFKGLAANPLNKLGRLVLARAYYLDDLFEFSVRELLEVRAMGSTPGLDKLIEEFGPLAAKYLQRLSEGPADSGPAASEDEGGVAEIDLDSDFIDVIEGQEDAEREVVELSDEEEGKTASDEDR